MEVKRVEPYIDTGYTSVFNDIWKEFEIEKYCCEELEDEISGYPNWRIDNDKIVCYYYDHRYEGRYCSFCGEKIVIS